MPDVSELLFGLVLAEAEHHPPSARRWRPLSSDRPKFPASATGCSSSAVGAHALGLSWLRRPVIAVDELSSRRIRAARSAAVDELSSRRIRAARSAGPEILTTEATSSSFS